MNEFCNYEDEENFSSSFSAYFKIFLSSADKNVGDKKSLFYCMQLSGEIPDSLTSYVVD